MQVYYVLMTEARVNFCEKFHTLNSILKDYSKEIINYFKTIKLDKSFNKS